MKYSSYEEYLSSQEWQEKKQERLRIDRGKCQMCNCTGTQFNKLHIHHLSYKNIYREEPYTDLVTLCESCHKAVHRMMNRINDPSGRRGWKDSLSYSTVTLNNESEV